MVNKFGFWKDHLAGWRRVMSRPPLVPPSLSLVPIVVGEPDSVAETVEVRLPNGLQVLLPLDMASARWLPMLQTLLTC